MLRGGHGGSNPRPRYGASTEVRIQDRVSGGYGGSNPSPCLCHLSVYAFLFLMLIDLLLDNLSSIYRLSPPTDLLYNIMTSFSAIKNTSRIMDCSTPSSPQLGAANGIRVISMFWIILGHCNQFIVPAARLGKMCILFIYHLIRFLEAAATPICSFREKKSVAKIATAPRSRDPHKVEIHIKYRPSTHSATKVIK